MMLKPNFLNRLKQYDRERITQDLIEKIRPYIDNPKFEPNVVKYASSAAEGMCKWVRAMNNFFRINEDIKPKKIALE